MTVSSIYSSDDEDGFVRPVSVFAGVKDLVWPHKFEGTLFVDTIAGGIPTDEKVAEAWLRTKTSDKDELIREAVAKTMAELGISKEEAEKRVASLKHFTTFKRDKDKNGKDRLYYEGRQLKAAIKEAAMVAVAANKIPLRGWGTTSKYLKGFVAEHIMVVQDKLYLLDENENYIREDSGITQQFVHTQYGSSPHYKSYVKNTRINFTVISDYDFTDEHWMHIWGTGEEQGIGASRSGGFGRYSVIRWDRVSKPTPKKTTVKKNDSEK